MKPFAKKFYKSSAWLKCRAAYIKMRHGLCERCSGPGKIVHHKEYLTPDNIDDPNITLNFNKLEYLCQDCHNKEHHEKHGVTVQGVIFDESGMPVQKT
ncbi:MULTISPECIES: HNH endonuclease [Priestia]|jgi:5-methylcytosine-specific restriction enzyme A|uniref:HNH endonuclease n=2 Tax=Priestia TaxID=2800373 RepID=A0A0V8JSH6_9BACI|nr:MULTISPECIES: HNH endonuclease [Priestia]KSU89821.1 HNH endonuclease [Priestia veravalensis]MBN8249966.1 HNH endonuclease [Priestia flexa]MEC0664493.1 HNH endonuclease [Priestia flexa]SCB74214.1 HNH endonuclease [Priestia flexa]